MKKLVTSGSPYEGEIGFSRASRIGNFISVAGTAALTPDGKTVGLGNVYLQTKRCLELSVKAIAEAGGSVEDVIRTRIILTDIQTWEEAARAHGEIFSEIRPACTFMEVSRFIGDDWLVETEMDAIIS